MCVRRKRFKLLSRRLSGIGLTPPLRKPKLFFFCFPPPRGLARVHPSTDAADAPAAILFSTPRARARARFFPALCGLCIIIQRFSASARHATVYAVRVYAPRVYRTASDVRYTSPVRGRLSSRRFSMLSFTREKKKLNVISSRSQRRRFYPTEIRPVGFGLSWYARPCVIRPRTRTSTIQPCFNDFDGISVTVL